MDVSESLAIAVGRLLIATLYLVMADRQARFRAGVEREMAAHGVPRTRTLLTMAIVVEAVGGLCLAAGYATRLAAAALIAYTLLATVLFYGRLRSRDDIVHCLKNLAIVGGLLLLAAGGAGPLSLESVLR